MAGRNELALAPFPDSLRSHAQQAGGSFGVAETVDDLVNGDWHTVSVTELISHFNIENREWETTSQRGIPGNTEFPNDLTRTIHG